MKAESILSSREKMGLDILLTMDRISENAEIEFVEFEIERGHIINLKLRWLNLKGEMDLVCYFRKLEKSLERSPYQTTFVGNRFLGECSKQKKISKPNLKNGLEKLGFNRFLEELKSFFQDTKKLRNHFSHKEGILVQDKLDQKLFKIYTTIDKEEYVPFSWISQIKIQISGITQLYYLFTLKVITNLELMGEFLAFLSNNKKRDNRMTART